MSQVEYSSQTPVSLPQFRSTSVVALGSNEENASLPPVEVILSSLAKLREKGQVIRAVSDFYRTAAFPAGSGPDYVNAAIVMDWPHSAHDLLSLLHDIEAEFDRQRKVRWGQRTLDMDLIMTGDLVAPDAETVREWMELPFERQKVDTPDQVLVPHPRMQDRAFVLVPLMDIVPDWVHPITGQSVRQMHGSLPKADRDSVKRLVNPAKRP